MTGKTKKNYYGVFWFNEQDEVHRENGPAVEGFDGTKKWCLLGQYHRENGPAIEWYNGDKEWYCQNRLHREDGPAIEYADGRVEYHLHGQEGPEIEQKVKENMARIQAEKEQQELLGALSQDQDISVKINVSSAKTSKKL